MKVVILAGGLGTRLSEYTKTIPKPMVKIAGIPMIVHIMKHYVKYGFNDFYIAAGYKGEIIKKYFKKKNIFGFKVKVIHTGSKTMTGGRLKRLKKYLKNESFMMTYGDGLANINLKKLVKFHQANKKLVTLTTVRPPARFGVVKLKGNRVIYFKEKSKLDEGWINGGFFVIDPKFLNFIKDDNTFLEKEPLEKAMKYGELNAYKHYELWQCVDTKRDKDKLEELIHKFD